MTVEGAERVAALKESSRLLTEAQLESFFADTIGRVADMDDRMKEIEEKVAMLPEIRVLLGNMSAAQTVMAQSAQSMAETHRKSEDRFERAEIRHEAMAQTAAGKNQVPIESHKFQIKWIVFSLLVPTTVMAFGVVAGVLYFTNIYISTKFGEIGKKVEEIGVNQTITQRKVDEVKEEVQDVKEKGT